MSELSVDIKLNQQQAVSAAKELGKSFQDAGDDIESGIGDGTDKAIDAIQDFEKAVKSGADNASDKLADAIEAVVELGDQTGKSGEQIVDALEGLGLTAGDAQEAFDAVRRGAEGAGDETEQVSKRAGDVGEGLRDLGTIARDVLEGDFGSAAGSAIEAIGGLAGAITGGVAGGAIAAALGSLVGSWVDQWDEASQKNEDRISEMYSDMLESGSSFLSASFIQKAMADIGADTETYNQALQIAKDLNVDVYDVVRAMAGDTTALTGIMDDQNGKRQEEVDAINDSNLSLEEKAIKLDALNTKYGEQGELFDGIIGAQDSATARFETINGASSAFLTDLINGATEATVKTDELGNSVYEIPGEVPIYVDAQTGVATTNLSAFKGDLDGVDQYVANPTVRLRVDTSAWDNWYPHSKTGVIMASVSRNTNTWE